MIKCPLILIWFLFLTVGTANSQTPQPTVTPSGTPVAHGNFQSMSDLHQDALAQATKEIVLPPPPTVSGRDFFDKNRFQIEYGDDTDFLGSNFYSGNGTTGSGDDLAVGLLLDDHWSLWLSQTSYIFSSPGTNQIYNYFNNSVEAEFEETVLSVHYTFGGSFVRPYLTLGGGIFYDDFNTNIFGDGTLPSSSSAPVIQAGLGLQFPLNSELSVFVEAKSDFVFGTIYNQPYYFGFQQYGTGTPITAVEFPVNAGLVWNLFGDGPPSNAPTSAPPKSFFLKIGGGSSVSNDVYNQYGFPTGSNFVSSAEVGFDFSNHFSLYASADQYPGFLTFMANLRYNIAFRTHFFDPYLFAGFGVSVPENADGTSSTDCLQLGVGMEFHLSPETALFIEAKSLSTDLASEYGSPVYSTVLSGLKFNFLGQPAGSSSSAGVSEDGQGFVEIAGAVDTPAQNWQSAYTANGGSVIGAGYEFKDGLVLQLDMENYNFTGNNYVGPISDNVVRLLPTVRYHILPPGIIRPYVLAGLGTEMESSSSGFGDALVAYLDAAVGLGVDVSLGDKFDLFAEGKYNWVFAYGVIGQDIPVLAGVRCGL
jgi:hypothetical protein